MDSKEKMSTYFLIVEVKQISSYKMKSSNISNV
jgi:hypothetical protein